MECVGRERTQACARAQTSSSARIKRLLEFSTLFLEMKSRSPPRVPSRPDFALTNGAEEVGLDTLRTFSATYNSELLQGNIV